MKFICVGSVRGTFLTLVLVAVGCNRTPVPAAKEKAPVIPISHPVTREVSDFVEYSGRTVAVNSVEIRARVTGYIVNLPFEEGSEVKKGDLLVEIDPAPYQAMLDQAQAQVALNQASFKLAETTWARDRTVAGTARGAISQQQLDQDKAAVDEAAARIKASQATVDFYKLNLGYTRITSPINGMVSRYYLDVGNLVIQNQTLLTTVVSLDPIYAYFDMDENTLERLRTAVNEGRIPLRKNRSEIAINLGLQNEEGFPHKGTYNFINNQVNPSTGTIAVRGGFANPKPAAGVRLLSPGMFVRIQLPIGPPHPALLVIDRAIGTDQGLKFVYVLDSDNKIQYRRVTTGALQDDGLRVITSGLTKDDWVVVGGLPQVRPSMEVPTEVVAMPSIAIPVNQGGPIQQRPQPPPPREKNVVPGEKK